VFDEAEIALTVRRLAAEVARGSGDEAITLVCVLKGALFFLADLARALPAHLDVTLDCIAVSSYGASHRSSGEVRLVKDASTDLEGKHVVIVEDIVEDGLTLEYLTGLLSSRQPASLRLCVLLDKPYRRRAAVRADYTGLVAPDAFIVGYGLDYQEKYRNLPYLARLSPKAFEEWGPASQIGRGRPVKLPGAPRNREA